jgi:hypothetical protein
MAVKWGLLHGPLSSDPPTATYDLLQPFCVRGQISTPHDVILSCKTYLCHRFIQENLSGLFKDDFGLIYEPQLLRRIISLEIGLRNQAPSSTTNVAERQHHAPPIRASM